MRRIVLAFLVSLALVGATGETYAQQPPEFRLGFKALADQIPDVVGQPLENEHYGPNGDSLQQTTKGLMVWRKADNWTAFTNGSRTWINGPHGVQERGNDERFAWEADPQRDLTLARDRLRSVITSTLGRWLTRLDKITVAEDVIQIEWEDDHYSVDNLQRSEWAVVSAVAKWIVENTKLRPNIVVGTYSTAAQAAASNTPGSMLFPIANQEIGLSDWLAQAKHSVRGR